MTPMHTRRRGCLGASRRGHETCPVRSITASEVESLVLGRFGGCLLRPNWSRGPITAVRRENGSAEDLIRQESEVVEALRVPDTAAHPGPKGDATSSRSGTSSIRPSRRGSSGC